MSNKDLQVKICCVSSVKEAHLAIDAGASAIGLVGPMPSGPGIIDDKLIATIARDVKGRVETFLLTSETTGKEIINHARKTNTTTIQLVDKVDTTQLERVREALYGIRIIQVIHVWDEKNIEEACTIEPLVDGLLLDSGNPGAVIKTLGGTGTTHNWTISEQIVSNVNIPVYLAGGLNELNVPEAVQMVQPFGVDLCSGVRTNGKLDAKKLDSFMKVVSRIKESP